MHNAFKNKSFAPLKYLADMTMVTNQHVIIISDQNACRPPILNVGNTLRSNYENGCSIAIGGTSSPVVESLYELNQEQKQPKKPPAI